MILRWLLEGARSLVFFKVRWERVRTGAAQIALLAGLWLLLNIGFQRLYVGEGAQFFPGSLSENLLALSLLGWAAYAARWRTEGEPSPAQLTTLMLAQLVVMALLSGAVFALLLRTTALDSLTDDTYAMVWLIPLGWLGVAELVLLSRVARPLSARMGAGAAIGLWMAATMYIEPVTSFWRVDDTEPQRDSFVITQEGLEEQLPLLDEQLEQLHPQRPGTVDMYAITFAPYEGEEVFRRESEMVSEVMAKRFDAAGRSLQLINHRDTMGERPWATPVNLQRAIEGMAEVMDKNEDVLFLHLTSHGASNGELAAQFAPLTVEPVVPQDLRKWLDDAGIRYAVISISACFAGNWLQPLSGDGTLVMTASDAHHTSYGCGSKSDLTFFGRAMYDELLRRETLSFEDAHAKARKVILQRENEAGKDDGYSNPLISVGAAIRQQLERQRSQLARHP